LPVASALVETFQYPIAANQTRQDQRPMTTLMNPPQRVITPPRSSGAQTLLAQANNALDNQRPNTAIVLLERAIRIEPREASLWVRLSEVHLSQRDDVTAFQHARKAIALAGSDSNKAAAAWLQLAKVYEAQGKTREARQIRQRYSRARG
jgi:tetratricopeptide (TPR) repeat protein